MAEPRARRYRFEPPEPTGVFLGLGVIQCGLLGGGLFTAAAAITAGVPALVAVAAPAAAAGVCFGRVGNRPAWQWLPLAAGWASGRIGGRGRFLPRLPLHAHRDGAALPLPACLAGLEIVELPAGQAGAAPMGAVADRAAETVSAVVPVRGGEFVLAATADQERLLAGWGDVLAGCADERGPVAHLSWSDFATPSALGAHRRWLAALAPPAAGDDGDPAASYRQLLAAAGETAVSHEVTVTVTVSAGRRRTHADSDLAATLPGAVDALARGLEAAGLEAGPPLTPAELRRLLRVRVDPGVARPRLVAGGRLADRLGDAVPAGAGPVALHAGWDHLHLDGAWHRTYWIEAWPRLPVGAAWLEPFLVGARVTRTITVYFLPLPLHAARRRLERDLVKLDSDAAARAERGRRVDARHHRATEAVLEREAELVSGYADSRYAALVTVSAASRDELESDCDRIEQLAAQHGLGLRCLDERQDLAWAAALPFGRAPHSLLGA